MIIADISDRERYYALHPMMKHLFDYVLTHPVAEMPAGRVVLVGEELFLNIDDSERQTADQRMLEVHRRYIDVQIPLTDVESFGWTPLEQLPESPDIAYDGKRDIAFYTRRAQTYVEVKPGQFYVMFPEDAHAPLVGRGMIRKVIGKLLV